MGLKHSPYQTGQGMLFAEGVIRGDRHDAKNIFRWAEVVLNLPGSDTYDPTHPWVYKQRSSGEPAAEFALYVNDNRATGNTKKEARLATRRVASICQYLGIQDAARKRRTASQTPGAWAGTILSTDGESVSAAVEQEKWDKSKGMIQSCLEEIASNDGWMEQ